MCWSIEPGLWLSLIPDSFFINFDFDFMVIKIPILLDFVCLHYHNCLHPPLIHSAT
jgi:hypothetical protein